MDVNQTQIVIQFKDVDAGMFNSRPKRNELVLTVKGNEGLQVRINSKVPGFTNDTEEIALDFKYAAEHKVRLYEYYFKQISFVFEKI